LVSIVLLAAWFWPLLVALAGIGMVNAGVPARPSVLTGLFAASFLALPIVVMHLFQQTPAHLHRAERGSMAVVTATLLTLLETIFALQILMLATAYAFIW
jgi:hypothetical protein